MPLFVFPVYKLIIKPLQVQITSEEDIVRLFNRGDKRAFEYVYKKYHKMMFRYSYSMLRDADEAEEVVQTVFLRVLERRGDMMVSVNSLAAYLMRSVRNQGMNVISRKKLERKHLENNYPQEEAVNVHGAERLREKDIEREYRKALNDLPVHCRTIFHLSRVEELTYREIAGRLNISVKTVETQMGRALKKLRVRLAEFLIVIIIITRLIG
ncbi:RNA polymerase sigma-70 factor [Pararcticibacter amylolyticus]|uniref:RNA polymerase sigma-70 factor n=1 Tax=Pararcticibacter amylolyticus TaxID=2173175 RepID=A0A2U2PM02_9SPHI|nr:RNA polymerase sigma-70 factor [Pararcticibacter amylolyticus]